MAHRNHRKSVAKPARKEIRQEAPFPAADERAEQLTRKHLPDIVAYCRKEILFRPRLETVVEKFNIENSDEWLKEAISLFRICPAEYSPAVEWHDEVGGLSFTAGLSISDALDCLSILRDGMIELIWSAVASREIASREVPGLLSSVLRSFDCALDAQAGAYVRESRRHLSEANHELEVRQSVFDRDIALATLVQQQFIPRNYESKNFRAEVRYVPTAGIGGDHASIFPVSEDSLYVTICDVTGHGIASALAAEVVSSQLRQMLRRQIDRNFEYPVEPLAIVRELNTLFHNEFQPLGMLLTFFAALVDSRAGTVTYSGAGHPPVILQCCAAHNFIELRSQNIILGASEDCVLGEGQNTVSIHKGDRIIFYTDGILEATDKKGRMLGLAGLRKIVEKHYETPPAELADHILSAAWKYYGKSATDDMSLILLDVLADTECPRRRGRSKEYIST